MITVELADNQYFALRCPYDEREQVKALGTYPDVKWDGAGRRWLIHCALWIKVIHQIPHLLNPIAVDVALALPLYIPKKTRKSARAKQMDRAYEKQGYKQIARFNKELKEWNSNNRSAK